MTNDRVTRKLEQLIDLQLAEVINVPQHDLLSGLPEVNLAQQAQMLSVPGLASGLACVGHNTAFGSIQNTVDKCTM